MQYSHLILFCFIEIIFNLLKTHLDDGFLNHLIKVTMSSRSKT